MAWFIQPYLKDIQQLSYTQIGIALSILNLSVGLTTLVAYKIEDYLGDRKVLIVIVIGIILPYLLISQFESYWIFSIILMFYITRGIATPILKDYINKTTSSDVRASVLSIRNFAIRVIFAILGPFFGWYSDYYSLKDALLIAGIILGISAIISALLYINLVHKKTTA
jgi:predicted MFS family arabinose efflux permease